MQEAIFKKTYSNEIERVTSFVRNVVAKKKIGKSYDVCESQRLKNGHGDKPCDVDEK